MSGKLNGLLIIAAVFGVVALAYFRVNHEKEEALETKNISVEIQTYPAVKTPEITPIVKTPEVAPAVPAQVSAIKTYTSSATYGVPENRSQSISISVTTENLIVTAISISQSKSGGKSNNYQTSFENNYRSLVLGKNIKTISLSRVGGASLTSNAFNQAIKSIANQL